MTGAAKIWLCIWVPILVVFLLCVSCEKFKTYRAEQSLRLKMDLGNQAITPENIQSALLQKLPPGTSRDAVLQHLTSRLGFTSPSSNPTGDFGATLNCGGTLWPPCNRLMRLQFKFDPIQNTLKSIQVEENQICP